MIGSGRSSIAAAADLARAYVKDMGDVAPTAVKALASLGSWGTHSQNQERDLHKWAHNLYGFELETFEVQMSLQARYVQKLFVVCEIVGFMFRDGYHICFPTP